MSPRVIFFRVKLQFFYFLLTAFFSKKLGWFPMKISVKHLQALGSIFFHQQALG